MNQKRNSHPRKESLLDKEKKNKDTLEGKLTLLEEYEKNPFEKFLAPPVIDNVPLVENPFAVINALSYQKKLNFDQEEYNKRYESLESIMSTLKKRKEIFETLLKYDPENEKYLQNYKDTQEELKTFEPVVDIYQTSNNVYTKKMDEIKLKLESDIKREASKIFTIGAIILFFILLLVFIKYLVHKYMSDNEKYYTINKALNIGFVLLSGFTLFWLI